METTQQKSFRCDLIQSIGFIITSVKDCKAEFGQDVKLIAGSLTTLKVSEDDPQHLAITNCFV
jgi:hypothetical protein